MRGVGRDGAPPRERNGQRSTPSTGGNDALPYRSARGCVASAGSGGTGGSSRGLTPASDANVAYQSAIVQTSGDVVLRSAAGTKPPLTNAAVRMPPSQFECFSPRSG